MRGAAVASAFAAVGLFLAAGVVGVTTEAASPAYAKSKAAPKAAANAGTAPAGDAATSGDEVDDPAFQEGGGDAPDPGADASGAPADEDSGGAAAPEDSDSGDPGQAVAPAIDVGSAPDGQPLSAQDRPPPPQVPADPAALGSVALTAMLTPDGQPLNTGLTWTIFGAQPGADGKLAVVGEAHGGSVTMQLKPGVYLVHAAYGRAGATKQISVSGGEADDTVVLNAGGIRLTAMTGKDQPIPPADISFDIYAPGEGAAQEQALLVPNAPAGKVVGLNVGVYHVVCRYGDANAVVRADIKVEPGKLTEATLYQKAARLTLKLVGEHGGEAMADTAWSVVTPSGETVTDSVGAFPSVVLAIGDYTAIAKHDGKIFERAFTVEAGLDRDVEVITSENGGQPDVPAAPVGPAPDAPAAAPDPAGPAQ